MGKNVLITGGAGFIGSNLSLKLVNQGYIVTVLDILSSQIHGENPDIDSPLYNSIKDKVVFIKGSVTNREDWENAICNQDAIIHLAAETGTGQSMYCIEKYVEVNQLGTALMLDILTNKNHQVKKIIIASSRSIYGEGKYMHPDFGVVYPNARLNDDMLKGDFRVKMYDDKDLKLMPTDENSKIHPSSVYGITKQNQEQMILTVCSTIGISAVSLRYQNVYGPGQSLSNPYTGILSIFSTQIRNGNDIQIFEDGNESRDFVYIEDVVDATILALENNNFNIEIFNVGSGVPTSVLEVANTLIKEYNSNSKILITGKFRLGDIRHNFACLEKISKVLGFVPNVKFNDGIKSFVKWVLSQKIEMDKLSESLKEMEEKGLIK
jgi:dTDP-L-rhamnose 4-epimerase